MDWFFQPLRVGAVIGWSVDHSPERRVTYRVLPIWAPEEEPPADNANLYHRTRHLIEPIISMEWLTEVSPEIELEMERFKFKTCSDPFFDGFDGKKFLIPTPGLTKIYPDDEAARQRLSMWGTWYGIQLQLNFLTSYIFFFDSSNGIPMEPQWNSNGILVESQWNLNETPMESQWNLNGISMESRGNPSGTPMESQWSLVILSLEIGLCFYGRN